MPLTLPVGVSVGRMQVAKGSDLVSRPFKAVRAIGWMRWRRTSPSGLCGTGGVARSALSKLEAPPGRAGGPRRRGGKLDRCRPFEHEQATGVNLAS